MNPLADPLLIVGLGNPGQAYENTRHNIGFVCVEKLAKMHGCSLSSKKEFKALFGQTIINDRKVMFLLPMTYMNLSGESVKKCLDFFKISSESLLVVCDDVALEVGKIRLRPKGSCGGHNGLRHIEQMLGTMNYGRLKIGVGLDQNIALADFVLGKFTQGEKKILEESLSRVDKVVHTWINCGYEIAIEEVGKLQNKNKTLKMDISAGEGKKS